MTTQLTTLNGTELNKIAHSSPTAEITMTALALRQRVRHYSDINRTRNLLMNHGEKIVDSDFQQLFNDLEKAGIGVIIRGRKGKPDRFEWYYSLKSVAKAALNKSDEKVEKIQVKAPKQVQEPKKNENEPIKTPIQASKREILIPLRPDFYVEIDLPHDVTKDEVAIISRVLQNIR